MPSIKIILSEQEEQSLNDLAKRQLRDPRAQILFLIRRQLVLFGLLSDEEDFDEARKEDI